MWFGGLNCVGLRNYVSYGGRHPLKEGTILGGFPTRWNASGVSTAVYVAKEIIELSITACSERNCLILSNGTTCNAAFVKICWSLVVKAVVAEIGAAVSHWRCFAGPADYSAGGHPHQRTRARVSSQEIRDNTIGQVQEPTAGLRLHRQWHRLLKHSPSVWFISSSRVVCT